MCGRRAAKAEPAADAGPAAPRGAALDDELVAALTLLRKLQMEESASAGAAYQAGLAELAWYAGGEYVIADELGLPVHPEWYSDEFGGCSSGRACAGSRCTTPGTQP